MTDRRQEAIAVSAAPTIDLHQGLVDEVPECLVDLGPRDPQSRGHPLDISEAPRSDEDGEVAKQCLLLVGERLVRAVDRATN